MLNYILDELLINGYCFLLLYVISFYYAFTCPFSAQIALNLNLQNVF